MAKQLKNIKMYESHVDEVTTLDIWHAVDKAQLDEYQKINTKNELTIGDIEYTIEKYFMDENSVPTLALHNKKTKALHYVQLALVWSGYENWSALDVKDREELRRKYYL